MHVSYQLLKQDPIKCKLSFPSSLLNFLDTRPPLALSPHAICPASTRIPSPNLFAPLPTASHPPSSLSGPTQLLPSPHQAPTQLPLSPHSALLPSSHPAPTQPPPSSHPTSTHSQTHPLPNHERDRPGGSAGGGDPAPHYLGEVLAKLILGGGGDSAPLGEAGGDGLQVQLPGFSGGGGGGRVRGGG